MAIALDTLAYARRLREAGFSEQQAEGQAQALAAAMTDTLATKQDLRELELRFEVRFDQFSTRLDELEKRLEIRLREQELRLETRLADQEARLALRLSEQEKRLEVRLAEQEARIDIRFGAIDIRFSEQAARFDGRLADLERRITLRLGGMMVAGLGAASALAKLL